MFQLNKSGISLFIKWKWECVQGKTESQKKEDGSLTVFSKAVRPGTVQYVPSSVWYVCLSSTTTLSVLFPYKLSKHLKSLDPQKILFVRSPKTVTAVAIQVIRAVTFIV